VKATHFHPNRIYTHSPKQSFCMRNRMLAVTLCLLFVGCRYQSEEALYPNNNCNTTDVSYSTTIAGIVNANGCLSCHGPVSPVGGFSLDNYAGVKAKVLDGRLFGAVNHSSGFSAMPQGGVRISQCEINQIKSWIDHGAPNN
jgi:mono/diheme cytochrome c family protein